MSSTSRQLRPATSPMMLMTSDSPEGVFAALVDDGKLGVDPLGPARGRAPPPPTSGETTTFVAIGHAFLDVRGNHGPARWNRLSVGMSKKPLDLAGMQIEGETRSSAASVIRLATSFAEIGGSGGVRPAVRRSPRRRNRNRSITAVIRLAEERLSGNDSGQHPHEMVIGGKRGRFQDEDILRPRDVFLQIPLKIPYPRSASTWHCSSGMPEDRRRLVGERNRLEFSGQRKFSDGSVSASACKTVWPRLAAGVILTSC